uniref:Uncharacterized protein n=1 Tax=Arundo donax TaxID=35708 RepID=A0A0A9FVU4_ARUDO
MDDGYMRAVRSRRFFPKVKNHHRYKVKMFLELLIGNFESSMIDLMW